MADDSGKKEKAADTPAKSKQVSLNIRLAPVGQSDQPVLANYSVLSVLPGMALIDFGFLEPAALSALTRIAQSGGKIPEQMNGKLAVRVALGYDTLANLHQQMGRVLAGLGAAARKDAKD